VQQEKMGISYFACDGCKEVLNNSGYCKYENLEFYTNKQYGCGTYCQRCARDIKQNRIPYFEECNFTFLLQTVDEKGDTHIHNWILNQVSRIHLMECMEELKGAKLACFGETKDIMSLSSHDWRAPEETYRVFLESLPSKVNPESTYWIEPPQWTTRKSRSLKLEKDMLNLENEIHDKQEKLKRKKRKWELVQDPKP